MKVISDHHCPTWEYKPLTGWRHWLHKWLRIREYRFKRERTRYVIKCGDMLICSPENAEYIKQKTGAYGL